MPRISNAEYEKFQQYKTNERNSHILTPDTLRFIIEANEYDALKIGQYFLEMLPKFREWSTSRDEKRGLEC